MSLGVWGHVSGQVRVYKGLVNNHWHSVLTYRALEKDVSPPPLPAGLPAVAVLRGTASTTFCRFFTCHRLHYLLDYLLLLLLVFSSRCLSRLLSRSANRMDLLLVVLEVPRLSLHKHKGRRRTISVESAQWL